MEHKRRPPKTTWQQVSKWYNESVGEEGHYYHQHIIIPGVIRLLKLKAGDALLDLACGQGVLARHLPQGVNYLGIDISPGLIRAATQHSRKPQHRFQVADLTKKLKLETPFSHAAIILALQNMADPLAVLKNAASGLGKNGQLLIVLNHPCFRVPRQSSWQIDEQKKWQFRRVDRYFKPMEIPIQMHPGAGQASEQTISFHHPLSSYFHWLSEAGFVVENMEEWCSNKESTGKNAKMENRTREEFPLFLCLICRKMKEGIL